MEYVRRRDRIIIKLPKVTDFYLATLIREEEGVFYVKLDRGDYFSFRNKDLIVERGIDRICPELITLDRLYDYIRGIGDAVTHVNKPDTESLIPKVEEVVTPEKEIRKKAIIDEEEEVEEDKSEDADSLEKDVPEDLEVYDEESNESEEIPKESKEPNSDDDMFDVPQEKLDESITIDEKKSEETEEPTEETEEVDDSVEVEESKEPTELSKDNEEIEEFEEPIDEVEDSVVIEDDKDEESDDDQSEEEPTDESEEVDDSVVEDSEEEEEPEEETTVKSNIDDVDIMVEDSANDDEGDIHEALFSNIPYYMRSLLLLEAARSFSKNDRLIIRVRAENKYYLATVTMNRKGILHVLFDHGEKHSLKPSSSLIMGIGQQKKYPYAITLNQLHRFLLVPYNTKIIKDKVPRKTLSKREIHEKAKELIPKDAPANVKRENVGPYPVKPFKVSYKKSTIKPPKQDKHETGYLSKMTSKEIDDMLS